MIRSIARRLSRYSLRSLLVLFTAIAVALALWSVYVQPFRAQRDSVAHLSKLGARFTEAEAQGPAWQRRLVEWMLGDKQFVYVENVDASNCRLTEADVPKLAGLHFVKALALDRADVNDANAFAIGQLGTLERLAIPYTHLTDVGIHQIARLKQLRTLFLTGVPVTDAAVSDLSALTQLRSLYIRWTKITLTGAEKLRSALPNCAVHHHEIVPKQPLPEEDE